MISASDPTQFSDGELLSAALGGDESAFLTLYRRRQSAVYRFALRMSGSTEIAEDVTQEVFLALMREGARYDATRSSLSSYLFGIARNQVLRRLERERSFAPLTEVDDEEFGGSTVLTVNHNPLGDLTRQETIEAVRQAVLALPPHYREVVLLCDLHELSYQETAEVLACAIGTVRSRLHRARLLLSDKLKGFQPAAPVAATEALEQSETALFALKLQRTVSS